jgi:hypothetical protein
MRFWWIKPRPSRGTSQWNDDPDHYPSVEFRVEVTSETGYPIVIIGSYNRLASALSYTMVHRGNGRIYALDLGKDHRNPDGKLVGRKHKHRWNEPVKDKEAYVPADITAPLNDPVAVWNQFCAEAAIKHLGVLSQPPAVQAEFI